MKFRSTKIFRANKILYNQIFRHKLNSIRFFSTFSEFQCAAVSGKIYFKKTPKFENSPELMRLADNDFRYSLTSSVKNIQNSLKFLNGIGCCWLRKFCHSLNYEWSIHDKIY